VYVLSGVAEVRARVSAVDLLDPIRNQTDWYNLLWSCLSWQILLPLWTFNLVKLIEFYTIKQESFRHHGYQNNVPTFICKAVVSILLCREPHAQQKGLWSI
jgi:hypothetical protein